jgi:hypothetical protein
MNNKYSQKIEPAFNDTSGEFDMVLPKSHRKLNILPSRVKLNGKEVKLDFKKEFVSEIHRTIASSLNSDWYKSLSLHSKISIETTLLQFIEWLNNKTITLENCYSVLKEYETYRVNEKLVKPQSTGVLHIINLLKKGIYSDFVDYNASQYITTLISCTSVCIKNEVTPQTLGNYFSLMPWLRQIIGETDYLTLESPKRLMDSFSIVISTTLLYIIEIKEEVRKRLPDPNLITASSRCKSKYIKSYNFCFNLIHHLGELTNELQPSNALTELILIDCSPTDRRYDLLKYWQEINAGGSITQKELGYFFTITDIFSPANWSSISTIEQVLFAWLCAWQAVQPSDVSKLKINDFVISKNQLDRPVSLQISYYKGRSGKIHQPPLLDARQIETRALLAYLDKSVNNKSLCKLKPISFSNSPQTIPAKLGNLFSSPFLQKIIFENLKQRQSNSVFLKVFNAMISEGGNSFGKWKRQQAQGIDRSVHTYRKEVERPCPDILFQLSHIKNSAIHARTDQYRDGDLVNQNSHHSNTEKINYLTDANKDWVNQNGRILRMVLNDIAHYVYKPNLDLALKISYDMALRTKVIQITDTIIDTNSLTINTLGKVDISKIELIGAEFDYDNILVLDTPETIVNMLHYINEAQNKQKLLTVHALIFFEQTVLPNVEWMQTLIQEKLSTKSVKEGQAIYMEIKTILPQLFLSELRAGVGA